MKQPRLLRDWDIKDRSDEEIENLDLAEILPEQQAMLIRIAEAELTGEVAAVRDVAVECVEQWAQAYRMYCLKTAFDHIGDDLREALKYGWEPLR